MQQETASRRLRWPLIPAAFVCVLGLQLPSLLGQSLSPWFGIAYFFGIACALRIHPGVAATYTGRLLEPRTPVAFFVLALAVLAVHLATLL